MRQVSSGIIENFEWMEQHEFTMIKLIASLFYDLTMIIKRTYFSSYLKNSLIIISFLLRSYYIIAGD